MSSRNNEAGNSGQNSITALISFLAGAALGVGLVLVAESKKRGADDAAYGEADLFV
jgi:hypothetical protein